MPEDFDLLGYADRNLEELVRMIEIRPGVEVDIKYIDTKEWRKLRKRIKQMGGSEVAKDLAAEAGMRKTAAKAVLAWRGMTPAVVGELMPVDESGLPEDLPCTPRNVEAMLLYSPEFGNVLMNHLEDLAGFREEQRSKLEKN